MADDFDPIVAVQQLAVQLPETLAALALLVEQLMPLVYAPFSTLTPDQRAALSLALEKLNAYPPLVQLRPGQRAQAMLSFGVRKGVIGFVEPRGVWFMPDGGKPVLISPYQILETGHV